MGRCCCSLPECRLNGCLVDRGVKSAPATPIQVGWTCPNCGAGVAPSVQVCPCVPVQAKRIAPAKMTDAEFQLEFRNRSRPRADT